MNQDLIRIVDSICRDKNIDRYTFFADLEGAMASAVRKAYATEEANVKIDPISGEITADADGQTISMTELGRIAAQTAKQVIIQRTRERERESIFDEFSDRVHTIITGQVVREERGNLLINIGRTEGFLPRSEQIPGETHQVGDRIRALILEVREQGNNVKIILSRSHPEFIIRLFELEVPEVAERIIEIKALAREAGYRSKVAVSSIDAKVDAVGACVGVRGSRIKNIVDELGGEKIDIVRWNESSQILIQNALKPAEVQDIALCLELGKATVVVQEDQLSLAIGKRGQNVRLASRLTKWDVDILTPEEYNKNLEAVERVVQKIDGVDDVLLDKLVVMGLISINDIDEVGPETLVENLDLDADLAEKICYEAGEEVIRLEEEREAAEKAKAAAEREAATAATEGATPAPSGFIALDDDQPADTTPPAESDALAAANPQPDSPPPTAQPSEDESEAPEALTQAGLVQAEAEDTRAPSEHGETALDEARTPAPPAPEEQAVIDDTHAETPSDIAANTGETVPSPEIPAAPPAQPQAGEPTTPQEPAHSELEQPRAGEPTGENTAAQIAEQAAGDTDTEAPDNENRDPAADDQPEETKQQAPGESA